MQSKQPVPLSLLLVLSLLLITSCRLANKPPLPVVVIVHDIVPVNTSQWPLQDMYANEQRLDVLSRRFGINYSLAVIPYTIHNYNLSQEFITSIKKYYLVQHGFRHYSDTTPVKEADIWHEFIDNDIGPIPFENQSVRIAEGKVILENTFGRTPTIFIAPQYRFDDNTLHALQEHELKNFDDKTIDAVIDSDPLWQLDTGSYQNRMTTSLAHARTAALQGKTLIIEIHLQSVNELGSTYLTELFNELEKNYHTQPTTLERFNLSNTPSLYPISTAH